MRAAGHPDDQQTQGEGCRYASLCSPPPSPFLGLASGEGVAAEHVVKLMNDNGKGEYMVFEPSFVVAAPGDTIKFVAVDQFHNAETLPEIWPEGAAPFKGELSKDVTLTVEKEGVYGIKCEPHFPMGMMAMVLVGKPVNASQVTSFKPPPRQRSASRRSRHSFRNRRGELSEPGAAAPRPASSCRRL